VTLSTDEFQRKGGEKKKGPLGVAEKPGKRNKKKRKDYSAGEQGRTLRQSGLGKKITPFVCRVNPLSLNSGVRKERTKLLQGGISEKQTKKGKKKRKREKG